MHTSSLYPHNGLSSLRSLTHIRDEEERLWSTGFSTWWETAAESVRVKKWDNDEAEKQPETLDTDYVQLLNPARTLLLELSFFFLSH